MDDLKLLSRSEDDLENEIKIVEAINKDINMNFGLEKCARICLKMVGSKAKYISSCSWFRASSFIKLNKNQLDAPLF
jgi:hypothetical protein